MTEYGVNNVGTEQSPGGITKIDIVVKLDSGLCDFYEIKIKTTVREAIREALGQILEYTFYNHNEEKVRNMFIVTPQPIDSNCDEWLKRLRNRGLSIFHRQYPAKD